MLCVLLFTDFYPLNGSLSFKVTIMACLARLREDTKFIETIFPRKHERFQIISASVDEVSCRFVGKNGERIIINANITVSIFVESQLVQLKTVCFCL